MEINETFTTTLQLQEMSSVVDYFLTDGFSKKESYGKVINNLKNIDTHIFFLSILGILV